VPHWVHRQYVSRVMIAASVPNFVDPHSGQFAGFKAPSSSRAPHDSRGRPNVMIATPERE